MEIIKKVSFVDMFKSDKQRKKEYISDYMVNRVKKDHSERTISERIVLQAYLELKFVLDSRLLGAIEAVLVMEGVLKGGEPFDLQKKNKKFLFVEYTEKEGYNSFIIRKAKEFLQERGVI